MRVALEDFLTQVRSIERTIDLRDHLVAFGQGASKGLGPEAAILRRSIRSVGLSGMQVGLDGAVLLLAAALEQFVADVMIAFTSMLPEEVPVYNSLPKAVRSANERLTGEALGRRRARFTAYELERFVSNLRDCQAGVVPYVLNGEAMALNDRNMGAGTLQEMCRRLGVQDIWAVIGSTRGLQRWSGRGGSKAAQARAKNRLAELSGIRNQIAHRVGRTTPGPDVVRSYIAFERALARSLVRSLEGHADSL